MDRDAPSVGFERAGIRRRSIAFLVDCLVVAILLLIAGFVLYPATGGRLQSAALGLAPSTCRSLASIPAVISVPSSLDPNFATECTFGLFGLTSAHTVGVGRTTQTTSGGAIYTKSVGVVFMTNDQGQPVRGVTLDLFWLPLLLLLRWSTDLIAASPGRWLCEVRLVGADGLDCVQNAKLMRRYAVFMLVFFVPWLLRLFISLTDNLAFVQSAAYYPALIVGGLCSLISMLLAVFAIGRRKDAFYDRAAGTVVLRTAPQGEPQQEGA